MALTKEMLVAVAIVALSVVTPALTKEFMVGDEEGWTLNADYVAWAAANQFHVGDTLVFKYMKGFHNVLQVDAADYEKCGEPTTAKPLMSGNDVVTLDKPGMQYFICSVDQHCSTGKQKVAVNVVAAGSATAEAPKAAKAAETPKAAEAPKAAETPKAAKSAASSPVAAETPKAAKSAASSPVAAETPAATPSASDSAAPPNADSPPHSGGPNGITAPKSYAFVAAGFGVLMMLMA